MRLFKFWRFVAADYTNARVEVVVRRAFISLLGMHLCVLLFDQSVRAIAEH